MWQITIHQINKLVFHLEIISIYFGFTLASLARSRPYCAAMFLQYLIAWICPGFHDFIPTAQLL